MYLRSSQQLPVELHRPIIEYVVEAYDSWLPSTISLLQVCKIWKNETERVVYREVDVPHSRLLFFCRTIVSRPDLGSLIRRLSFTAAGHRPKLPGDAKLVSQMLKLLPNLIDLAISEGPLDKPIYTTEDWVVGKNDSWIFDGCPFTLERYRCHFSWGQELVDFLSTQRDLREFFHVGGAPDNAESVPDLPDQTLANCHCLAVPAHTLWGMRAPYTRVTHLLVKVWDLSVADAYDAARSISPLGEMLKCLCLSRMTKWGMDDYPSISMMVRLFAPSTSNLRYLAIYDDIDFSRGENKRLKNTIAEYFPKLEVFVWAPLWSPDSHDEDFETSDSGFSIDSDDEEDSFDKTQRYACAMMADCQSLKLFVSHRMRQPVKAWLRDSSTGKIRPVKISGTWIDNFKDVDPEAPLDYFLGYKARDGRLIRPLRIQS